MRVSTPWWSLHPRRASTSQTTERHERTSGNELRTHRLGSGYGLSIENISLLSQRIDDTSLKSRVGEFWIHTVHPDLPRYASNQTHKPKDDIHKTATRISRQTSHLHSFILRCKLRVQMLGQRKETLEAYAITPVDLAVIQCL